MATNQTNQAANARPPVVVVLGHVDHGKTKLLDTIRKTNVIEGESGGITQHIGAYQAEANGRPITFLDTPGHEAFSAIRSRGAKVADVAILVVAADESVKPQTKEAIRIIKSEGIPFVVAVNKIDKDTANVPKVIQDLAAEDVLVEAWGGNVPMVEISAAQNKNISELLDMILLVADLEGLEADANSPAEGVIIESHLDKRRGYIATALVQKGALNVGDWIAAGRVAGKIKAMEDHNGKSIVSAGPSTPVVLIGLSDTPDTGAAFMYAKDKNEAEELARSNISLAPLFAFLKQTSNADKKPYNLILKADVKSSLEAIEASLSAINSEEIWCNVVSYDIGDVGENDVKTALATKADIISFRTHVAPSAKQIAEKEGIRVQSFDIIYELIEAIRKNMAELLSPQITRTLIGKLKVLAIFKQSSGSQVVGGKVMSGVIKRGGVIDIVRGKEVVGGGKLAQLQKNKEEVQEVKEGSEAGLRLDSIQGKLFEEIKEGDILELYEEEETARTL